MGFSRHKISHSVAYTIAEKAIRFRHPDYNLDQAQKLISSSVSRHLSTRNISSKSMRAFLSNLANRPDRQNVGKCLYSFVGDNNFCTQSGYFTIPNVMFKFNFLAVVVRKIFIPEESTLPHLIVFLISTF